MFRHAVCVLCLLVCLAGCAPAEESSPPETAPVVFAPGETPEKTLEQFIEAQRAGDLDAARATIYPDDNKYRLDGPVVIQTYQILGKEVLSAIQAAEYTDSPRCMEGDVVLEVYEEYDQGRTSSVTYFMREIHGEWRIYSISFTL